MEAIVIPLNRSDYAEIMTQWTMDTVFQRDIYTSVPDWFNDKYGHLTPVRLHGKLAEGYDTDFPEVTSPSYEDFVYFKLRYLSDGR